MTNNLSLIMLVAVCLIVLTVAVSAEEGMYVLDQIDPALFQKMKALGLELTKDQIYNEQGTGIAYAILNLGGGTASFVSSNGLMLTNHHVAFAAIARISTPEKNYIEEGFLAATPKEEIPAPGYQILVLQSMKDITDEMLSAVKPGMTDLQRHNALEMKDKEIVKREEKKGEVECRIAEMNQGAQYYLFTYFKIKDIRIVYVPPDAVGNYGGEIDNWMWPRHEGDFSFLRAYVAPDGKAAEFSSTNVPYKPKVSLKFSTAGVKEGDFVMAIGYPGRTNRYRTSHGVKLDMEFRYPFTIKMATAIINTFEEISKKDKEAAIKLSFYIKAFANVLKNNQGMLEGLEKINLPEKKEAEEKAFMEFIKSDPELEKKYGTVLNDIGELFKKAGLIRERSALLRYWGFASPLFNAASTINKWTLEQEKKDMQREPGYQERDLPDIKLRLQVMQRSLVPEADRKAMELFLKEALALPEDHKFTSLEKIIYTDPNIPKEEALTTFLDKLYAETNLTSAEERMRFLSMKRKDLMKIKDPFIEFASKLEEEREIIRIKEKEIAGAMSKIAPLYLEGVALWKKTNLYPDANSTMRMTYGQVKGYSTHDAVMYRYITTLTGMIEKNTGEDPFICPEKLIKVYNEGDFGSYVDKNINDVPVDFLATTDSTGGNSGSPVVNNKGEVIGALFDGNYDALYSDYYFNPEMTRSINVDARYILFIADKLNNATSLLEELNIK
ncbi:MAG: hypothetical protein A2Y62_01140 [Candidatus Fischerbacteria bacterium RBG_13_37_8]|uniref:Dipeptidyl-peptidase n=1 Tax=Candidatus Fischerbacteria bacterium RBG_13_37_8 TaxID=1817863 RepID=A0A1F5VX12_9BACT|nr:MAG: hypothetical protein A2Y62_01140 [Candidatus Fischerbacteria bacterium RBG_13_37_8]